MSRSTVVNNSGRSGAGISSSGDTTVGTLANSAVVSNIVELGAGLGNCSGVVTVANSTISGNRATSEGGGACVVSGVVALTNSTVSANGAITGGGGIYIGSDGELVPTHSTVASNSAAVQGGGIAKSGGTAGLEAPSW